MKPLHHDTEYMELVTAQLRKECKAASSSTFHSSDDDLAPARGIAWGVVLGLFAWAFLLGVVLL